MHIDSLLISWVSAVLINFLLRGNSIIEICLGQEIRHDQRYGLFVDNFWSNRLWLFQSGKVTTWTKCDLGLQNHNKQERPDRNQEQTKANGKTDLQNSVKGQLSNNVSKQYQQRLDKSVEKLLHSQNVRSWNSSLQIHIILLYFSDLFSKTHLISYPRQNW